jgi:cysteine-rich repeat protein
MKNEWRRAALAALAATVIAGGAATAGAQVDGKCQAGKLKCSTGLVTGVLGCFGKDNVKPSGTAVEACVAKVVAKYTGGADPTKGCFAKLEAKGPKGPCVVTGDAEFIQQLIANYYDGERVLLDPGAPPSTLSKCTSGQQKCVGNLLKALLTCEGKNVAKPSGVALSACVQKALAKYTGGVDATKGCFAKLEAKGGCAVTGKSDDALTQAQEFYASLASALDCGDGVVSTGEACDDGNRTCGDGCSATCTAEACGNDIVDCGETCDDGNTVDGDACPSSCAEAACTPTATPVTATVSWNAPSSVSAITVLVDYPEGKVNVPGHGGTVAPGTFTSFPSGTSQVPNVLGTNGYAVKMVVSKATAITPRPGTLFKMNMTTCSGAPAAVPGDYACTVLEAFGTDGITPVAATCSVGVP